MLLMVEKAIRGRIFHVIHRYTKANNQYMKDFDKNKEYLISSHLKYWNVNNLYGWAVPEKLSVNNFKQVQVISGFDENFIKTYSEENDEEYFLEVDVQYPKNLHKLYNDLAFLPERMKIENVEKIVENLYDKEEYVIHTRTLKQTLNYGLVLKHFKKLG